MADMPETPKPADCAGRAEALRRRLDDWAAGAEEGKALDRQIARGQSPQERLDAARELIVLAGKLRPRA